jgi:uncharacterized repeat protein (TIGR01451 family)
LLTYTLVATNTGPDPAVSVEITDTLPVGARFVGAGIGAIFLLS